MDGFEFLTMAEAGEVGHWSVVNEMNKRLDNAELAQLIQWALPIQEQHFQNAKSGSMTLARSEDPNQPA